MKRRKIKRNSSKMNFPMDSSGDSAIGELEIQRKDGEYDVWTIIKRGRLFVIGTPTNTGLLSEYYYKMEPGETVQNALQEVNADLEVLAMDGESYMSRVKKVPKNKKIPSNAIRGLRRNAGGSLDIKKIKTIDIYGKLWRDKTYGNTYFASRAVINFGMPSEQEIFYPFQYGYGNSYSDVPLDDIMARAGIEQRMRSGWRLRDEYGIILRQGSEYAKKSEVKAFGEGR